MYRRRRFIALGLTLVLLAGAALVAADLAGAFRAPKPLTRAEIAAMHVRQEVAAQAKIAALATSNVTVALPSRAGVREPVFSSSLFALAPSAHVVFGYLPYWMLDTVTPADLDDVSTVAYFGVSLQADGAVLMTDPGWADLSSSSLADALASAHHAHDKVLLTVSTTLSSAIDALLADPGSSAQSLAASLSSVVLAHGFDGVDLDIEGRSATERAPFVTFVQAFTTRFRSLVPGASIVVNTYPQSAGSTRDFFDVAKLAPMVNELFIMAYDMDNPAQASSNDPLVAPALGLSDVQTLLQYTRVVPRNKIVLGMPYYGYDFSTVRARPGSLATTASPEAVLYSSILAVGHQAYWDVQSATPYAMFSLHGQAHVTWYDDPLSLAIKTSLAADFRIAGVGAWALGFEGGSSAMLAALTGGVAPQKS